MSTPSKGQIILYEAENGGLRLDVRLEGETVWLTQQSMAELFHVKPQNITMHLKNIYAEGELDAAATCKDFLQVQKEGARLVERHRKFYNLDAIISVGYRIKSQIATRFRIWATQKLTEFIKKGFLLDDQRLKEADNSRYFEELLARIRDIRSSEKVFWRKILDLYATSIDYDPAAETTRALFKQIQNKMHWAAHGHTAAEIIYGRADANQPNMGITNFPGNKLLKRDVEIAKNYLTETELNLLNRIVTAHLELAEIQALNQTPMTMSDWSERLDQFLTMTGRELLTHAGTISHQTALEKARTEYEAFRQKTINQPSPIEQHFIEAEQHLSQLQKNHPKTSENQ